MNQETVMKKIENTEYWDARILEFEVRYFGDEIVIWMEEDHEYYWKIQFLTCQDVHYSTDAGRRGDIRVRDMGKPQLGYWAQDIQVTENPVSGFYKVAMDLDALRVTVVCQNVLVEKVRREEKSFYWERNKGYV